MNYSEDRVVDEFLVMRCQAGDETALTALVTKWQPPFLKYAAVMTRDQDLAADVVQEAWIKVIRALPNLRDPLKFPGWAYRIVNNQCLDALRRPAPIDTSDEITVSPIKALELNDEVSSILARLSPDHRSVLALHYLQGFDVSEIANIIRKPSGTVKSRLHHARENFRVLLEAQPPNETDNEDKKAQEDTSHGHNIGHTRQQDTGSTDIGYRPA